VTFSEIIRDKVLYNILLFGIVLFVLSFAASALTFIAPARVVVDFGFTAINLSCSMIAILNGSAMLAREFERRTVLVALARPISRLQFVIGKFVGLALVIALNWFLLSAVLTVLYLGLGGSMSLTLIEGFVLLLMQSWLLTALAIFFSTFTTTSISVIILVGLYLLGNSVSSMLVLIGKMKWVELAPILRAATGLFPNLEHFNVGFTVTYALPIELGFIGVAFGYMLIWVAGALYGSGRLLASRES
jgi:ABC-type transport system involved in multi-copper enzyme maturation permease subunit